jgi:hypothetical protein
LSEPEVKRGYVNMVGLKGSLLDLVRVLERAATYDIPPDVITLTCGHNGNLALNVDYTKMPQWATGNVHVGVLRALAPVIETDTGELLADVYKYYYGPNGILTQVPLEEQFDKWMIKRKKRMNLRRKHKRVVKLLNRR